VADRSAHKRPSSFYLANHSSALRPSLSRFPREEYKVSDSVTCELTEMVRGPINGDEQLGQRKIVLPCRAMRQCVHGGVAVRHDDYEVS